MHWFPFYTTWLYWSCSFLDYTLSPNDYHNFPNLIQKIPLVFLNTFFFLPLASTIVLWISPPTVAIQSTLRELSMLALNVVFGEIWFYCLHRTLHRPSLFFLHQHHHQVKEPIGVLALYAHPFDAIVVNIGSLFVVHLLFCCSTLQLFTVGTVATLNTILYSHSSRITSLHHIHHRVRTHNFGVSLFMDRLFGTNSSKKTSPKN